MFLRFTWKIFLFVASFPCFSVIATDTDHCADELEKISILFFPKHPGNVPPSHVKLKVLDAVVSSGKKRPARFAALSRRAERRGGAQRFIAIEWEVPQSKVQNLDRYLRGCTQGMGCASYVSNALWHSNVLKIPFPFNRSPLLIYLYLRLLAASGALPAKIKSYGKTQPHLWNSHTLKEVALIGVMGVIVPIGFVTIVQQWAPGVLRNVGYFLSAFVATFCVGVLLGGHYVHRPARHIAPPSEPSPKEVL